MPIRQSERIEILKEIATNWLDLLTAVRALSDQQMLQPATVGDWSIKDVLAHVTYWEQRGIEKVRRAERHEPLDWPTEFESINREQALRDRPRPLDEVLADLESTHQELMDLLEVSPALSRDLVMGFTARHYVKHAADIRAAAQAMSNGRRAGR